MCALRCVQARNECIITNEAGKIQSGPTGTLNVETIKLQYRIKELLPLNKLEHNVRALSRGRQYY
jgi:hypothetical protein